MSKTLLPPPPRLPRTKRQPNGSTNIWGRELEHGDFIKLPRIVLKLGRHGSDATRNLQPRHIVLLLSLAARKFQDRPIRAYWQELAEDLGVKINTVRRWAYEMKGMGLLSVIQHRGRDEERNRPGIRNERNSFSLDPFIQAITPAFGARKRERETRHRRERADDE